LASLLGFLGVTPKSSLHHTNRNKLIALKCENIINHHLNRRYYTSLNRRLKLILVELEFLKTLIRLGLGTPWALILYPN